MESFRIRLFKLLSRFAAIIFGFSVSAIAAAVIMVVSSMVTSYAEDAHEALVACYSDCQEIMPESEYRPAGWGVVRVVPCTCGVKIGE